MKQPDLFAPPAPVEAPAPKQEEAPAPKQEEAPHVRVLDPCPDDGYVIRYASPTELTEIALNVGYRLQDPPGYVDDHITFGTWANTDAVAVYATVDEAAAVLARMGAIKNARVVNRGLAHRLDELRDAAQIKLQQELDGKRAKRKKKRDDDDE